MWDSSSWMVGEFASGYVVFLRAVRRSTRPSLKRSTRSMSRLGGSLRMWLRGGGAGSVRRRGGNGEQFEEALHGSGGGGDAAADVIDQDELSAGGAQDAGHFVEGFGVVGGDGAEPEGADDGVEGGVVER